MLALSSGCASMVTNFLFQRIQVVDQCRDAKTLSTACPEAERGMSFADEEMPGMRRV